jgi:hypothetical protein
MANATHPEPGQKAEEAARRAIPPTLLRFDDLFILERERDLRA